jgi:hypothetical protein
MLVALAAKEFDPEGHIYLDVLPDAAFGTERTRRVNRVATLDGSAAFNDYGPADADLTIELEWPTGDRAKDALVDRMLRLYKRVTVSMPDACYEAAPETFSPGPDSSTLRLLVARRLSA